MLQQLIEETGDLYDGFAFLVGELWPSSGQRNHSPTFIVGGLFFCSDGSQTCFGQECFRLVFVVRQRCPRNPCSRASEVSVEDLALIARKTLIPPESSHSIMWTRLQQFGWAI